MKKLIIPVLFGVFGLFFSGKPTENPNCGPYFYITKGGSGSNTINVTKVEVINHTWGGLTTYNNPVFPISHADQGYDIEIKFYFDRAYGGVIQKYDPCEMVNFHRQNSASIRFDAFCATYYLDLIRNDREDMDYSCTD